MKIFNKFLILLMSTLLIFSSMPWSVITQAEGKKEEYKEQVGLNYPKNEYTIPLDNPEAEIKNPVFSTEGETNYPQKGEVIKERTANSKVFSNGDGTFTEKIYQEPIHTEEVSGEWADTSTDLKKNKEGDKISGKKTKLDVSFPTKGKGKYVTVKNEEHQIEYELIKAEGPSSLEEALTPTIEYEDNIIYHRNILPKVDMRSILFDTSLKEDIILKERVDYDTFQFQVHTKLKGAVLKDGSIEWVNGKDIVFETPAPFMMDSKVDDFSGDSARSTDAAFTLKKNKDGYLLTLSVDSKWLGSPDREYPVYIDPTTSLPTASDSFVSSLYPTANYEDFWEASGGYYSLRAGYYDGSSGTQYSFLKQNVSHLEGAIIESATFKVYTAHSYYATTATGLWVDSVNATWSPSTITWNNKPASTAITSTSVYRGQWADFNVTSTVQQWVNGTKSNNGFKLHTNGNGQTYWKKFYASENSSNKPYLSVTYSYPKPVTPTVKNYNYNNGSDTGYLDITWPSVAGATDYIVYLYNGTQYQGFRTGNVTSWSTKGKKIWPTDEQLSNGLFNLSSTGTGQELPVDPSETYRVSGGKYTNSTGYWVRVAAVYDAGSSSMSEASLPYLPLSKTTAIKGAASINLDNSSGYVSASWEPVRLAEGYKVLVFNGRTYEEVADIKVDATKPNQALQWHSQGKKIWPTPADIAAGKYTLRADGTGVELPKDPTPVYQVANAGYAANKNYFVRVKAYNTKNPESIQSDAFWSKLPDKQEQMGIEDYWPKLETPAGIVNAINGNLTLSETDLVLSGRGPSVQISRTYNSLSSQLGSFGRGWLFSYDIKLTELENKDVQLIEEDGTFHLYKYVSEGKYTPPNGLYLTIQKVDGQFILTMKNQNKLYFTNGRLTKIEDGKRNNNNVELVWTSSQLLITDASNRTTTATFINNLITQVEDYGGRIWTYKYTGDQLTSYTNPEGATYSYEYANGKLSILTDANGNQLSIYYDGTNRVNTVQDAKGKSTSFAYGESQAAITHPATETSEITTDILTYNVAGNPKMLVRDAGTGNQNLTSKYTYELHESIEIIDAEGNVSENNYDSQGNLLTTKDARGSITSYTYNLDNQPLTINDLDGTTSYSYNSTGDLIGVTNASGEITQYEYDQFGNQMSMLLPDGTKENYTYNSEGNYQKAVTDLLGRTTTTVQDKYGNKSSLTDPMSNTTFYSYDLRELLTEVKDANGNSTRYSYDENGNLTSIKNALNGTIDITYNSLNQLSSRTEPLGQKTTIQYDSNGNIMQINMASGYAVQYSYDENNQIITASINDNLKWSYLYDGNGNTTTVTNEVTGQTKSFLYNENNNLIKESNGTQTINYGYNLTDGLVSVSVDTNGVKSYSQKYTRDSLGLLTNIERSGVSLVSFGYTETSMPATFSYANGIQGQYNYDQAQQLTSLSVKKGTEVLLSETNSHDKNGNITKVVSNLGTSTYTYDVLNQLTSQTLIDNTKEVYSYDAVGNRTKKTKVQSGQSTDTLYTYNANNQLITVDDHNYFYDADGNRTKDNNFVYVYNEFNQLEVVKTLLGETVAVYAYDEEGRRISKTINGKTINYYYNQGINVLHETDSSGNIIAEFSYDQSGSPLTMTKNGETYYYVLNGHKDVVAMTDSLGQRVASYTYDAWGNILSQNGILAEDNPYRYAGYRYDSETKMYYLIARYYNSQEGVFLAIDPNTGDVNDPKTQNGYNYANNNPVMYFDPTGEIAWWISAAVIGGLLNALPILLDYIYKHRTVRGFNWWRFAGAFGAGAITSIGGAGLYRVIAKEGGTILTQVIAMSNYGAKAYIINTVAAGNKPSFNGLYMAYLTSGLIKGLNLVQRAKDAWKKGGSRGLKRFTSSR